MARVSRFEIRAAVVHLATAHTSRHFLEPASGPCSNQRSEVLGLDLSRDPTNQACSITCGLPVIRGHERESHFCL
jgi:hypothetical protein